MMTTPLIIQPTAKGQAICPYCGVGCRLWMESANGKVIRVKGVADAPANLGGLCAKGATLPQVLHTPDRLAQPLLRTRRDGERRPVGGGGGGAPSGVVGRGAGVHGAAVPRDHRGAWARRGGLLRQRPARQRGGL